MIQFALGLEASNFLRGIGLSSGGLLSFAAVADQLRGAMNNVWQAVERGGALKDLSLRTGETASSLFKLQAAFGQVGADGGSVPMVLRSISLALAGVTEDGKGAGDALAKIGLTAESLKGMDAAARIRAIATGLRTVDDDTATQIAQKLGGRMGAGVLMQASRDLDGFNEGLQKSEGAAAIIGRTAAAFDRITDALSMAKLKMQGFWAGVASGLIPTMETLVGLLDKVDMVKFGTNLGTVLSGLINALKGGELQSIIAESIRLGIESGIKYGALSFAKLGNLILMVFEKPLTIIQGFFDAVVENFAARANQAFSKSPFFQVLGALGFNINDALGISGMKGTTLGQAISERKKTGLQLFDDSSLADMNAAINKMFGNVTDDLGPKWKALFEKLAGLANPLPAEEAARSSESGGNGNGLGLSSGTGQPARLSRLEQMGAWFGSATSTDDYAKRTANAVETIASYVVNGRRYRYDEKRDQTIDLGAA